MTKSKFTLVYKHFVSKQETALQEMDMSALDDLQVGASIIINDKLYIVASIDESNGKVILK